MKLTNSETHHAIELVRFNLEEESLEDGLSNIIDYFTFLSWDKDQGTNNNTED